ncbi:MAG TPA: spore protease YyaC [Bacillota bacterium]|jgi:putative sporulation protein YyaC|nr:spore protease YyaC [Bacillota bacterium]HOA34651.1 spore protease YyaC [Bacillota bacterium]HOJ83267.1 spore protease YyaC [Bacillota bacterium]HOL16090.1 spore protease YyaC [Bacillota bacterium]HPZ11360.1 spore protease YyaC [Bacillota bacterium]
MVDLLATPPCPERLENGTVLRVNCKDLKAVDKIAGAITILMSGLKERNRQRLVICIGSDRSTGDSLGPLVGAYLKQLSLPRTSVWGTLADPVHALNLEQYTKRLKNDLAQPLVIAVDASLGKPGSVGLIEVGRGPLMPGAGVNKKLPPVGHIYLSGIVNLGGFMEQMVLQSTRLFHVFEIAMVIARGLQRALNQT